MTAKANIAVFLERGKKVTACNNKFRDITTMVKCKVRDTNYIRLQDSYADECTDPITVKR
jgi:hypothetical protein